MFLKLIKAAQWISNNFELKLNIYFCGKGIVKDWLRQNVLGLRPVSPPKEFSNTGGFGSVHNRGPSFESFGSESGLTKGQEPPPPNVQIEPPLEGVNGSSPFNIQQK